MDTDTDTDMDMDTASDMDQLKCIENVSWRWRQIKDLFHSENDFVLLNTWIRTWTQTWTWIELKCIEMY